MFLLFSADFRTFRTILLYSQQAATSYRVQVTGPAHSEFLQRAYVLNELGTLK